jgi:hypothetical protein
MNTCNIPFMVLRKTDFVVDEYNRKSYYSDNLKRTTNYKKLYSTVLSLTDCHRQADKYDLSMIQNFIDF